MIPIQALLARILHDPDFGRGRWEIAYLDRQAPHLVRVPLEDLHTQAHIGFVFEVVVPMLGEASPVAGGGRYDSLIRMCGAPNEVPAVGGAVHTERLLAAVRG